MQDTCRRAPDFDAASYCSDDTRLPQEILQCRAELNILRKKCRDKDQALKDALARAVLAEGRLDHLQGGDLSARAEIQRLSETRRLEESRHREELQALQGLHAKERKGRDQQIANLKSQNVRLRQLLISHEVEKQDLYDQIEQLRLRVQAQRASRDDVDKMRALHQTRSSQLDQLRENLESRVQELKFMVGQSQRQRDCMRSQLGLLQNRLRQEQIERQVMREQSLQELQSWVKKEAGYQREAQSMHKEMLGLARARDSLQSQLSQFRASAENERNNTAASIQIKNKLIAELQLKISRVEGEAKHHACLSETRMSQIVALEHQRLDLTNRLQDQTALRARDKQSAEADMARARKQMADRDRVVSDLRATLDQLEVRIKCKDEQLANLGAQLQNSRQSWQAERRGASELKNVVVSLQRKISQVASQVDRQRSESEQLRQRLGQKTEEGEFMARQAVSLREQVEYQRMRNLHLEELYARYRMSKTAAAERLPLEETRVRHFS